MKKFLLAMVSFVLAAGLLAACGTAGQSAASTGSGAAAQQASSGQTEEKLLVYSSFYPMYDFTQKIGGERVEVVNMVPAGTEPHDWGPAATDIVGLEKADVFVYNGAGLEHWVEDVLAALGNKSLVVAEASAGISLLEGHAHEDEEEEHAEEEEHDEEESAYDPHVWLNPQYVKVEAENIKNALIQADPAGAEYYEENYKAFAAKLDVLDTEFESTLAGLPGKTIVVAHEAFGYLCSRYGLTQMGIEGLSPDSEPDAARMAEVIDFVKQNNVKVIFFEELVSPKVAEAIAAETGAGTEVLNPIEGLTQEQIDAGDDYFSLMRQNLKALEKALQ
ncbi:MAG: metal ABC transporter substrate-binding protein [Oscillospiraceae bacterium]